MVSNQERRTLRYQVGISLRRYFKELDGSKASEVYQMVMNEVEGPMLEAVSYTHLTLPTKRIV